MIIDFVKIIIPSIAAFSLGILIAPILISYLYKNKAWKKKSGKEAWDGTEAKVFNSLHKEKEIGTPRMGGILIWLSSFITIISIWILAQMFPEFGKLDFLSRDQTWIPLSAMILGAFVGLFDDLLEVKGNGYKFGKGLSLRYRLGVVGAIGLMCGWWFFEKLEISSIGLPFGLEGIALGWLIIPFFALVMMAVYSGGIIDGLDGLAGGVFAIIFTSYAVIALSSGQINLAAFSAMIAGAILAFLWFNIPPARFYMSETGTMALTITLTIVAFMTDELGGGYGVIVLPVIAFPLLATVVSVIIQILSKKFLGKKIFKVAPIHHHFEAIGWPNYKVVMRFWIISVMFAMVGTILAVIGL